MKVILAIEHGLIPPTIGLRTLNSNIDLEGGKLSVVTESTKWPDLPIRRASVNSFGYGGANAHAILESVDSVIPGYRSSRQRHADELEVYHSSHGSDSFIPDPVKRSCVMLPNSRSNKSINEGMGHTNGHTGTAPRHQFLLPFSAHDEKTLLRNVAALQATCSKWALADIAHTLSARRSTFSHRTFAVAESGDLAANLDPETMTITRKQGSSVPVIGYVFSGTISSKPPMRRTPNQRL